MIIMMITRIIIKSINLALTNKTHTLGCVEVYVSRIGGIYVCHTG
jgi:hypothetical protein